MIRDSRRPKRFRAARGFAIFLSVGGTFWTIVFALRGDVTHDNWGIFVGMVIVAFWFLRAFDIGTKPLWIGAWLLSICWHLLWTLAGFGLSILGLGLVGIPAFALALLPLIWVVIAFACSAGALASELDSSHDEHQTA